MFIRERSNPYKNTMPMKLNHLTFDQLVVPEISTKILTSFYKGLTGYLSIWEKRYLQERKKLGETIKYFIVPCFIPKTKTEKKDSSRVSPKKRNQAKKEVDTAHSLGYTMLNVHVW